SLVDWTQNRIGRGVDVCPLHARGGVGKFVAVKEGRSTYGGAIQDNCVYAALCRSVALNRYLIPLNDGDGVSLRTHVAYVSCDGVFEGIPVLNRACAGYGYGAGVLPDNRCVLG